VDDLPERVSPTVSGRRGLWWGWALLSRAGSGGGTGAKQRRDSLWM